MRSFRNGPEMVVWSANLIIGLVLAGIALFMPHPESHLQFSRIGLIAILMVVNAWFGARCLYHFRRRLNPGQDPEQDSSQQYPRLKV